MIILATPTLALYPGPLEGLGTRLHQHWQKTLNLKIFFCQCWCSKNEHTSYNYEYLPNQEPRHTCHYYSSCCEMHTQFNINTIL